MHFVKRKEIRLADGVSLFVCYNHLGPFLKTTQARATLGLIHQSLAGAGEGPPHFGKKKKKGFPGESPMQQDWRTIWMDDASHLKPGSSFRAARCCQGPRSAHGGCSRPLPCPAGSSARGGCRPVSASRRPELELRPGVFFMVSALLGVCRPEMHLTGTDRCWVTRGENLV